jgi:hypothetical protein
MLATFTRHGFVDQQCLYCRSELLRICHDLKTARLHQLACHLRRVELVRARKHGLSQSCGLQQVVPTHRHQAATDKGHVCRGIPVHQQAHLVDQHHVGQRCSTL